MNEKLENILIDYAETEADMETALLGNVGHFYNPKSYEVQQINNGNYDILAKQDQLALHICKEYNITLDVFKTKIHNYNK